MRTKLLTTATLIMFAALTSGAYILVTEPGRIAAAEQALYLAATSAAHEVTTMIQPAATLHVTSECPDGTKTASQELPTHGLIADALVTLIPEGCRIADNSVDLTLRTPDLEGMEQPLTGDGFRGGSARFSVTTQGVLATVTVDASAKAGIFGRGITATAAVEVSGEGAQAQLAQDLSVANLAAAPAVVEEAAPEVPNDGGTAEPKPEPGTQPVAGPTVVATPIPVTRLAPNQIISQDKLDLFGESEEVADLAESDRWIKENKQWGEDFWAMPPTVQPTPPAPEEIIGQDKLEHFRSSEETINPPELVERIKANKQWDMGIEATPPAEPPTPTPTPPAPDQVISPNKLTSPETMGADAAAEWIRNNRKDWGD